MKKLVLSLSLLLGLAFVMNAQTMEPKKALKQATKLYSKYAVDQSDLSLLDEAKTLATQVVEDDAYAKNTDAWTLLGEIYDAYSNFDIKEALVNPNYTPQFGNAAEMAFSAYKQAVNFSEKAKDAKTALSNMSSLIPSLQNMGIERIQNGAYADGLRNFEEVLEIHDLLKKNGVDSPLDDDEQLNNSLYLAGLAATAANDTSKALKAYSELEKRGYDSPDLYDGFYKAFKDSDPDKALDYLAKGRELYPDDLSLLYSQINYYLSIQKIDSLEGMLKAAIEQDPENISLYTTLGNVYDRQFQEYEANGDRANSDKYFDQAKDVFTKAVEVDPNSTEAVYSLGALYFNKAALQTKELETLANDYSAAGIAKFDKRKAEIDAVFDESLPYFQKAERMNPSDLNTLRALKEIYARSNELEISEEFKSRIEKVEAGQKIESSYFNK